MTWCELECPRSLPRFHLGYHGGDVVLLRRILSEVPGVLIQCCDDLASEQVPIPPDNINGPFDLKGGALR